MELEVGRRCLYSVEFLPRLQSLQISLSTDSHKLSLLKDSIVMVEGSKVSHDVTRDGKGFSLSLGSPHLDLSSHSLKLTSGILNVKARPSGPIPPIPSPHDVLETLGDPNDPSTSQPLTVSCGFCYSKLTRPENVFKRVLPLPSESWDEFSGGVFCHYHEGDRPGVNSGSGGEGGVPLITPSAFKIAPKVGDCLYSTSKLLLTEESLDLERVHKNPKSKDIHCSRCLMFLGRPITSNDGAAVSLHRLRVEVALQNGRDLCPTSLLENHFAVMLYSFTQSKMAFRYFVKDHSGTSHLHVWMLNVCSELFCNCDPGLHSKFSGCDYGKVRTGRKVLKLLFNCNVESIQKESSLASDMELETDECLKLKLLLVGSNRSLPPTQRKASGYEVGYLHFFSHS